MATQITIAYQLQKEFATIELPRRHLTAPPPSPQKIFAGMPGWGHLN
ncbi:MAG: hypothetical protein MJA27_20835 [Pseudanabaenales cyanobacterium]|nr:hypothetical protein [Pseudanabaenales cyanobacterium]